MLKLEVACIETRVNVIGLLGLMDGDEQGF
jgi:hypothetical protein